MFCGDSSRRVPGKKATCGAVGYVAGFSFRRRNQATVRPRTAHGGARARLKRHLLLLQSSAATELATNERLRCSDGEESFPTIEASYRGGSFPTCRDRCPLRNEPRFQAIERQLKFPIRGAARTGSVHARRLDFIA